jgi:hypothetical protein
MDLTSGHIESGGYVRIDAEVPPIHHGFGIDANMHERGDDGV